MPVYEDLMDWFVFFFYRQASDDVFDGGSKESWKVTTALYMYHANLRFTIKPFSLALLLFSSSSSVRHHFHIVPTNVQSISRPFTRLQILSNSRSTGECTRELVNDVCVQALCWHNQTTKHFAYSVQMNNDCGNKWRDVLLKSLEQKYGYVLMSDCLNVERATTVFGYRTIRIQPDSFLI